MENKHQQYSNGEITVTWKPEICTHSTLCWKSLTEVFNPRQRPWINLEAADMQQIKSQIDKCPSGALSYIYENEDTQMSEEVKPIKIEVKPKGPLVCYGKILVKDINGNEELRENITSFCRCGASANKPFCDGSHRKIEFE